MEGSTSPSLLCSSFLPPPQPEEKEKQTRCRQGTSCWLAPAVFQAEPLGSPESTVRQVGFHGVCISTVFIPGSYEGLVLKLAALLR